MDRSGGERGEGGRGIAYSLSVARKATAFPLTSSRVELFRLSGPRGSVSLPRVFTPSRSSLSIPTSSLSSPPLSRSAVSFYGISCVRSSPAESALRMHLSFCTTKASLARSFDCSLICPVTFAHPSSLLLCPLSFLPSLNSHFPLSPTLSRFILHADTSTVFPRTKYSRFCSSRTSRISRFPALCGFVACTRVCSFCFARGCNFHRTRVHDVASFSLLSFSLRWIPSGAFISLPHEDLFPFYFYTSILLNHLSPLFIKLFSLSPPPSLPSSLFPSSSPSPFSLFIGVDISGKQIRERLLFLFTVINYSRLKKYNGE